MRMASGGRLSSGEGRWQGNRWGVGEGKQAPGRASGEKGRWEETRGGDQAAPHLSPSTAFPTKAMEGLDLR